LKAASNEPSEQKAEIWKAEINYQDVKVQAALAVPFDKEKMLISPLSVSLPLIAGRECRIFVAPAYDTDAKQRDAAPKNPAVRPPRTAWN
jgi:hypothetical protein